MTKAAQVTRIAVQAPYDHGWVMSYLAQRALPSLEAVRDNCYRRRVALRNCGWGWVSIAWDGSHICIDFSECADITRDEREDIVRRVRRVFDTDAQAAAIHEHLMADSVLGTWVVEAPGLRVPGAWDGYETAVRAILGQQVSVARATELATKLVQEYGAGHFPAAADLARREVAELGMPGRRGRAISTVARGLDEGRLSLSAAPDFAEKWLAIEGIGPWTVNYLRLRVLKDPDAFPHNDWVVLKRLEATPAQALRTATPWQPWRAYALMYIWYSAARLRSHS